MIKHILFDLDDTLLDFHKAEKIALTKTLIHLGIEPKEEILSRYSELNLLQWKLLEQGLLTREAVKIRRYELLFEELGVDALPEEATKYYESCLGVGHYFVEGAEAVLNQLAGNYRLYVASNGTANVQRSRMKSADMMKFFSDIFISQEIGFNKPSKEFFDSCFSRMKEFSKEETVIVGDSLTSDIKGGKAAGIKTIWYNPEKSIPDIVADYEISNLVDLIPLLQTL